MAQLVKKNAYLAKYLGECKERASFALEREMHLVLRLSPTYVTDGDASKKKKKKQKKAKTGNVFLVDDDIVAKVGDQKTFLSFADASHGLSSGRQAEKDKHR